VEKAMMDQRRENRNAFPPMDFPWITGRSLSSRKKKKTNTQYYQCKQEMGVSSKFSVPRKA